MKIVAAVAIMLSALLAGCNQASAPDKTIDVPAGYILVAASAYGQFENSLSLYLRDSEGRIFKYANGKIKSEIVIPKGYTLVAASAYGKYTNILSLYCLEESTGRYLVCPR